MDLFKRWFRALFLFAAVCGATAPAASAVEGYPGILWFGLAYDNDNFSGSSAQAFVQQGIQWTTLPGDIEVVTYAEYRHRSRTQNQLYYDTGGPAVGLEFRHPWFSVGVDYYWERLTVLGENSNREQYYASTYQSWSLADDLGWAEGLPGSIWGQVYYDNDKISGSGVQGFIQQGIQWFSFGGVAPFITYAEYRHRSRTENPKYYDSGGPAVGAEVRYSPFSLGVDYYWERLPVLGESSNRWQIYLACYYTWDLMDK